MQILRADPDHPIRKRLWQAAGAVGLIVFVLVARETIVRNCDPSPTLSVGEDFLPVYAAGRLLREGRARDLYAMEPLATVERQVVGEAHLVPLKAYGPFLNPPFFAAAYVPFAALPYRSALSIWVALNTLLVVGLAILLCRMLPSGDGWKTRGLVCLLLVLPLPFWEAVWYQQNTFLSLFLTCVIVWLWRSPVRRGSKWYLPDPAGLVCGLLFYKPQLALTIALALIVTRGIRAIVGLSIVGLLLLGFTLSKMPGTFDAFVNGLPPTIHWLQTAFRYNWGQQLTPQSFWRLLIQGTGPGDTVLLVRVLGIATALPFGAALAVAGFRIWRRSTWRPAANSPSPGTPGKGWGEGLPLQRFSFEAEACAVNPHPALSRSTGRGKRSVTTSIDRFITATICTMPLLMPYYMDYDLLLLAVPAVLLAGEWIANPKSVIRADRYLLAAWIALFLDTYANPGLGAHLRLNLAVPLIGVVSALSIGRCFRKAVASAADARYDTPPVAAAA